MLRASEIVTTESGVAGWMVAGREGGSLNHRNSFYKAVSLPGSYTACWRTHFANSKKLFKIPCCMML